jgi:hypothetical protein
MRFTDAAKAEVSEILKQNPGKVLTVVLRGYG